MNLLSSWHVLFISFTGFLSNIYPHHKPWKDLGTQLHSSGWRFLECWRGVSLFLSSLAFSLLRSSLSIVLSIFFHLYLFSFNCGYHLGCLWRWKHQSEGLIEADVFTQPQHFPFFLVCKFTTEGRRLSCWRLQLCTSCKLPSSFLYFLSSSFNYSHFVPFILFIKKLLI